MKNTIFTFIIIAITTISLNQACSNTENKNTKDSVLTEDVLWNEADEHVDKLDKRKNELDKRNKKANEDALKALEEVVKEKNNKPYQKNDHCRI